MESARYLEVAIVGGLFAGQILLWSLKRRGVRRATGVDPEVLARATSPVQAYFAGLIRVMPPAVAAIVALHALAPTAWPPLARLGLLDTRAFDVAGGIVGVAGLGLCCLAQVTMGNAWRVGIDAGTRTELVTTGIFGSVRNPTYTGLHLLDLGLWLIWPSTLVAAYALLFFVVMEVQVRAEEEHLIALHGDAYRRYAGSTARYLPGLY
jgi:protein-S-isoprenylcysteine O-methyltransferase Ste14